MRGVDAEIEVVGETLTLLRDRAVNWPAARTLIVADIHFGKAAAFRKHGLPVPEGDTQADLERLAMLVQQHEAERLIIAGDLLHAASSKSQEVRRAVEAWRHRHSQLSVVLVSGNHDKSAGAIPDEWHIIVYDASFEEPPFGFVHDPADIPTDTGLFYFCGHLHPAISLSEGRMRTLKAPCFWQTPRSIVLPGFGKFTGSKAICPAAGDHIYAITRDSVVPVPQAILEKQ